MRFNFILTNLATLGSVAAQNAIPPAITSAPNMLQIIVSQGIPTAGIPAAVLSGMAKLTPSDPNFPKQLSTFIGQLPASIRSEVVQGMGVGESLAGQAVSSAKASGVESARIPKNIRASATMSDTNATGSGVTNTSDTDPQATGTSAGSTSTSIPGKALRTTCLDSTLFVVGVAGFIIAL